MNAHARTVRVARIIESRVPSPAQPLCDSSLCDAIHHSGDEQLTDGPAMFFLELRHAKRQCAISATREGRLQIREHRLRRPPEPARCHPVDSGHSRFLLYAFPRRRQVQFAREYDARRISHSVEFKKVGHENTLTV
jgi:hypothetical protein